MERFAIKDAVEIPKLGLKATRLQHKASGLIHLHVRRNDPNKVFSLAFKTDAPDRTGVPHILEHTTLCGSEHYPVRDPFFKMQTRSLANFMNAMTGFDYTYYPFATTNKADFANLQNVYMDSVFQPLLKEEDFRQEGWRLEPNKDLPGGYELKGVVFNEMKGNMSMPAYQFYMAWFQSIYASMQYAAGDPLFIPDLKYEELVAFHRKNYQPSNCFTFSYGDMPVEEVLEPLTRYLDEAPVTSKPVAKVPQPLHLTENVTVVRQGPIDPMYDPKRQHKVSLTWYVGEPGDLGHVLVWRVLSTLLTDGHAAPFYKSLIESGIATDFSVNSGFDETPAKLMFTIGAQGVNEERLGEFETAVFCTLEEVVASGFDSQRVDGIVHQAELGDREVDAHYGMSVLSKVVSRAFTGRPEEVMDVLDNEKLLNDFKQRLAANPRIFQDELAKMKKQPFFKFTLVPSEDFEGEAKKLETAVLNKKVGELDAQDKARIESETQELEESQKKIQNVDLLPTVHVADISRKAPVYPVANRDIRGTNLIERVTGTQGVSYVKIMRDISNLAPRLLPFLSMYTDALTSVGTQKHTMGEMEDLVKLYTGGIGVSPATRYWGALELSYGASALDTKLDKMYELLEEFATAPKLEDTAKLKQLLDGSAANVTNVLSQSGHRYAVSRAAAFLSDNARLNEQLSGFPYVKLVQRLAQLSEKELEAELVPQLKEIHSLPWALRTVGITRTEDADHTPNLEKLLRGLNVTDKPSGDGLSSIIGAQAPTAARTHVELPFQVSHVGAAVRADVKYTDPDAAALQILSSLLTHHHLHTEIREKGGAYGGGSSFNPLSGLLTYYSYRDPAPANSVEVMRNAGKWAAQREWTERDVEEGVISLFQSIDSPISPRSEISTHLLQMSDETRQIRRTNLLSVKPADLKRVAEKYLVGDLGGVCIIGPADVEGDWESVQL